MTLVGWIKWKIYIWKKKKENWKRYQKFLQDLSKRKEEEAEARFERLLNANRVEAKKTPLRQK